MQRKSESLGRKRKHSGHTLQERRLGLTLNNVDHEASSAGPSRIPARRLSYSDDELINSPWLGNYSRHQSIVSCRGHSSNTRMRWRMVSHT